MLGLVSVELLGLYF